MSKSFKHTVQFWLYRQPAMDFLHEKLNVAAAPPGPSTSFLANLLEPRPDFDTIAAYADWGTKVQQEMLASKARKTCPVAWVGLFVDQEGLLIVFHFARKLKLGDAKTAARTMTSFLVEELQEALYANLHPFDELDRRRLDGWVTPISLRPEGLGKKRAREEEGGECQTLAKRPKTMAQFVAQWEEDDAEVDCPPAPTVQSIQIARRDPDARCELTTLEQLNDPLKVWEYCTRVKCTIVVAEMAHTLQGNGAVRPLQHADVVWPLLENRQRPVQDNGRPQSSASMDAGVSMATPSGPRPLAPTKRKLG